MIHGSHTDSQISIYPNITHCILLLTIYFLTLRLPPEFIISINDAPINTACSLSPSSFLTFHSMQLVKKIDPTSPSSYPKSSYFLTGLLLEPLNSYLHLQKKEHNKKQRRHQFTLKPKTILRFNETKIRFFFFFQKTNKIHKWLASQTGKQEIQNINIKNERREITSDFIDIKA